MSDSPYKPPRLPPGAGHAPIPSVPVAARRHGAIPAAPVALPRRPTEAGEVEAETDSTEPANRWAYQYRGNAGTLVLADDSMPGGGGSDVITDEYPLKPAIDLPEARPLAVQFYQDTQTLQPTGEPLTQNFTEYVYDISSTTGTGPGILPGAYRLSAGNDTMPGAADDQAGSAKLYVAIIDGQIQDFLDRTVNRSIELQYGVGSFFLFQVTGYVLRHDGGGIMGGPPNDYLEIDVTPDSSIINESDGPIHMEQATNMIVRGLAMPNAAVRARVRYRSGKSEVQFDCDWAGGFQVHADRLEISRVVFAPDTTRPYLDAAVDISATVIADAPRPGGSVSLTVPPVAVPRPTGERYYAFPIHALARRVNLLLKYGNDEDSPGDVPLGQIFLAFVGKFNRSLCYIDAMAAREALFGGGLPVPSGVAKLVVSNRSTDDSMQIGVLWRLDI